MARISPAARHAERDDRRRGREEGMRVQQRWRAPTQRLRDVVWTIAQSSARTRRTRRRIAPRIWGTVGVEGGRALVDCARPPHVRPLRHDSDAARGVGAIGSLAGRLR